MRVHNNTNNETTSSASRMMRPNSISSQGMVVELDDEAEQLQAEHQASSWGSTWLRLFSFWQGGGAAPDVKGVPNESTRRERRASEEEEESRGGAPQEVTFGIEIMANDTTVEGVERSLRMLAGSVDARGLLAERIVELMQQL